ncbi:MAG TPA: DUF4097 family beta strand repeat-containing protein [Mucilaginibacter sp.]|nr:DUF4097 family beta strand repeat-containing protein [Mucilaginibacter sp.]
MKTYLTLLFVVCQTVFALAQDEKTPYMTKSLANDAISSVVVKTSAGGITVSGKSGEQPRIEVYIKDNRGRELSRDEIKQRLDEDYDMSIDVSNHELQAIVKNKHQMHWSQSLQISFRIYVPEQVSTDLHTSGGGIVLDHLKGKENFGTSGGGLLVDNIQGSIDGSTSGGGIQVTNSGDDISLTTSGGGIIAKNCTGNIRLRTSGGGLILENLKGTIDAHTSGGGVEANHIEGELTTGSSGGGLDLKDMNCSLDASTSAGSVYAEMKQVGKYLKLNTSAGNIDLQLPAKQGLDLNLRGDRVDETQFSDFKGQFDKDYVHGTVNGGGAPVDASASSGHINVRFN